MCVRWGHLQSDPHYLGVPEFLSHLVACQKAMHSFELSASTMCPESTSFTWSDSSCQRNLSQNMTDVFQQSKRFNVWKEGSRREK